jgi:hypothetical protein
VYVTHTPWKRRAICASAGAGLVWALAPAEQRTAVVGAQTIPTVPTEYQPLYAYLSAKLDAFQPGTPAPGAITRFGGELYPANSDAGDALLDPQVLDDVGLLLDRMKQLGMHGVTLSIHEYCLARAPRAAELLAFYKRVVAGIRARGLLLAVESQAQFGVDYAEVTFDAYRQARRKTLHLIVSELQPNYLAICSEPSTEAQLTGFSELLIPSNYGGFLAWLLQGLPRGTSLIGAGGGSWQDNVYFELFTRLPVDFVGLHVYPIVNVPDRGDFLGRVTEIATLARQRGKRMMIGECWLHKATTEELVAMTPPPVIFQRDVFSFWQPLDMKFIKKIADVSRVQRIDYVSTFWTQYHLAYVDYADSTKRLLFKDLILLVEEQAERNALAGVFSPTGQYYSSVIRGG